MSILVVLGLAGLILQTGEQATEIQAQCLGCHASPSMVYVDPARGGHSVSVAEATVAAPWNAHADLACTECHTDVHSEATAESHGVSEETGSEHTPLETAVMERKGAWSLAAIKACGDCHDEAFEAWTQSAHAEGLIDQTTAEGSDNPAPTCVECHGAHEIRMVADPGSPVTTHNIPALCMGCHASQRIVGTFQTSVHGQKYSLTGKDREVGVAVCSTCHSYHEVRAAGDPESQLHLSRRAEVCGQCHRGANEKFALSFSHDDPEENPVVHAVHIIHVLLTGLIAGSMLVFMGSEAFRIVRCFIWRRPLLPPTTASPDRLYRRWTWAVRIQHVILVTAFTLLSVSGIPLMFPGARTAQFTIRLLGGVDEAALIHRVGAVLLIIVAIIHAIWVFIWILRGKRWSPILFNFQDAKDSVAMLKYSWGISKERPRMGRYAPPEKFEYLAAAGGTVVMTLTGLLMWFPELSARFVGGAGVQLAQIMHGHEGVLAVVVILIIHVCWVHFMPGFWPMSMVWLTGRIRRDAMEEYHAAELEEIEAGKKGAGNR